MLLLDRRGSSWEESQQQVHGPVSSVEAFWRLLRHIHPASALCDADYSLFEEGLAPAREDPNLQAGGRWILALVEGGPSQSRGHVPEPHFGDLVDDIWGAALLALVGDRFVEALGNTRNACGVVVSLRDRSASVSDLGEGPTTGKLALWLRDADDKEQVLAVGQVLREVLEQAVPETARTPRGGWRLAFEDFRRRAVTLRL